MLKQRIRADIRYLIKMVVIYLLLVLVLFAASGPIGEVLKDREMLIAAQGEEIPSAMLTFAGMYKLGQFPAEAEVFFLGLLVLNLVAMMVAFLHGISAMRASFESSSFSFLFMQIMPLWKHYLFLVGEMLLTSLLSWWLYVMIVGVFGNIIIGRVTPEEGELVRALLDYMGARGIAVVLFMTALGMVFGLRQHHRIHAADLGLSIMGASFILGNIYKIPQYIGHVQVQEMVKAQTTMQLVRILKWLRLLCPFSWLNPFNIYNGLLDAALLWLYIALAILLFVAVGLWYCRRDWEEM